MLYEFQLGRNAKDAVKNICSALGEDVLNDRKCQRWFKNFRSGNLSLKNEACSGRVSAFNKNALQARLIQNNQATQKELAEALNCSQKTISNQLRILGKV